MACRWSRSGGRRWPSPVDLLPGALSVVENNESIARDDLSCRFCAQVPVPTVDDHNVEGLVEQHWSPGMRQMIIPKDRADVGERPSLRLDNTEPFRVTLNGGDVPGTSRPPQGRVPRSEFQDAGVLPVDRGQEVDGGIAVPGNGVPPPIDRLPRDGAPEVAGHRTELYGQSQPHERTFHSVEHVPTFL